MVYEVYRNFEITLIQITLLAYTQMNIFFREEHMEIR